MTHRWLPASPRFALEQQPGTLLENHIEGHDEQLHWLACDGPMPTSRRPSVPHRARSRPSSTLGNKISPSRGWFLFGVGLRFLALPTQGVSISADYAWGRGDSRDAYIYIGDAF